MNDPINRLKFEIIEEYNRVFDSMVSIDISAVAEAIEKKIFLLIEEILYTNTTTLVNNTSYNSSSSQARIAYKNDYYTIRVQEPFDDPQTIVIAYINLYSANRKLNPASTKRIEIVGVGKYKGLELIYPDELSLNHDLILNIIKTIFETSYSWLFHKIKYTIKENHMFSNVLYSRMKIALSNRDDVYNSIWFVVQDGEKCMLLLDKENIVKALEKLDENAIHPDIGPFKLLDEFINMRLPFEKSFALQSLKEGKCIDGEINLGNYFDELPLLATSQMKIFTSKVSVYPILTDWKIHLYLSFPTEYKNLILPIIDMNKESIIKDFKELDSRIKKMIKAMKTHSFDVDIIADFLGTFAASYTKSFLKS